jgi:broad specificity phosphatase PhoE
VTRLWLVRHGQTDWNVEGRWQGQTPLAPPLNATGLAQARALAEELSRASFDALYGSDLLRARQTAEIIAARLELPVLFDPRLREVNLGTWEGLLGEEVARDFPLELAERRANPAHQRPPDGETVAEVAKRMRAALGDIASARPVGNVIVVTHGVTLATALCIAHDLPLASVFEQLPLNAHPMIVDWPPSRFLPLGERLGEG